MSVIRIKHERNYVVLQKEMLENPNISLKAKGLWAYCLSKPDNWEFHITQLVSAVKEGRDFVRNAIDELIEFGYCIRIQNKDKFGKWTTVDYEIFETSQLKKSLPQTCFPLTDDPLAANPPLLSNDSHQVLINNPPPPSSKEEAIDAEPATKEEEEEILKRLKERPRNAPKIHNNKKWRLAVLEDIRRERIASKVESDRSYRHKCQALKFNNTKVSGDLISALDKEVVFSAGNWSQSIPYDLTDEEWAESTKRWFK